MSAEFPLDVRRDEDEPDDPCEGEYHVFPADAEGEDRCLCGKETWD